MNKDEWALLRKAGWQMGSSLRHLCRVCRKMISPTELAAYSPNLTAYHRGCLNKSPMACKTIEDEMSEYKEPKSEALPGRTIIYGICGPGPSNNILRCPDCKKIIKETGKDWYCAKQFPVATVKGV